MAIRLGTKRTAAFTLIELLVVIAVIGILVAIMIPAVQSVRGAARKTACSNNLRQVGIAINNFESAKRQFPPGQIWVSRRPPNDFSYAWSAQIIGFLEEQSLLDALDLSRPFVTGQNLVVASQSIPVYLCPATGMREAHRSSEDKLYGSESGVGVGLACIDYLGIAGPSRTWKNPATGMDYGPQRGVLIGTKGLPNSATKRSPPPVRANSIIDGLSKTAVVTECAGRGLDNDGDFHGTWVSGRNISHISGGINSSRPPKAWSKERVYSQHGSGAHFLFCDGSLRFLTNGTKKDLLKAICSRDGEELVGGEF